MTLYKYMRINNIIFFLKEQYNISIMEMMKSLI
jgi:hypothetical protein